MKHIESQEQQALFQWAELNKKKYPELELLYHCPNGGRRNVIEAARLKREGVKAGVPDVFLPVARNGHHGLYLEMKSKGGRITDNQCYWIQSLMKQGYMVWICRDWENAKNAILGYLNGGANND